MSKLWAIEIVPTHGRPWINYNTVRRLKHDALQAYVNLNPADSWWDVSNARLRIGAARAVKVKIVKEAKP